MSTTLTNGLKLPDKGSVDWYADMQNNYAILDGAVGTVTEHTTQIAGKAPAVHTHTKADITDLFNSANTWSANNTFSVGAYFYNSDSTAATSTLNLRNSKVTKGGTSDNGSQIIQFLDKDNKFLSQVKTAKSSSGTTQLQFILGNIDSNNNSITGDITFSLAIDGAKQFIPGSNNTHNLGNSSYQWNNLYAKNYYYNGVAWGLDKANEWTGNNSYTGIVSLDSSSDVAEQFKQKLPKDVSTSNDAMARVNSLVDSAGHYVVVETIGHWSNYVAKNITLKYKNDSTKQGVVELRLYSDGSGIFYPQSSFECDLGNSYNKWKTLNGINPGALSLPDIGAYTDLTSNIPSASLNGSTEINLSSYITTKGWLAIVVPDTNTDDFVFCQNGSTLSNRYFMSGARGNGFISLMMPINNTGEVKVQIKASSISFCRFYPGLGNV